VVGSVCGVKLAFYDADTDTDTDILARIVARMSVSVSVSASWNANFRGILLRVSWQFLLNTYGRRAFSFAGPAVCNCLLEFTRDPAICADFFRRIVKT